MSHFAPYHTPDRKSLCCWRRCHCYLTPSADISFATCVRQEIYWLYRPDQRHLSCKGSTRCVCVRQGAVGGFALTSPQSPQWKNRCCTFFPLTLDHLRCTCSHPEYKLISPQTAVFTPLHAPLEAAGGPERRRQSERKTWNNTEDSKLKCTTSKKEREEDNCEIKTKKGMQATEGNSDGGVYSLQSQSKDKERDKVRQGEQQAG